MSEILGFSILANEVEGVPVDGEHLFPYLDKDLQEHFAQEVKLDGGKAMFFETKLCTCRPVEAQLVLELRLLREKLNDLCESIKPHTDGPCGNCDV